MVEQMERALFAASALFAAMTASAHDVTIERTFNVTASDFSFLPVEGPNTPAAVDPVELNFTVIWDHSAVTATTALGLTINSVNLPNPPYSSIFAADASGQIGVGTFIVSGDCSTRAAI
jgi:hypothetical protein